jgi:hypothetical protein
MYKFHDDKLDDSYVEYAVMFDDKEYVFTVDRAGKGFCLSTNDALDAVLQEDDNLQMRAFLGDRKARKRLAELDDQFTVAVKIPKRLANMLWHESKQFDPDDEDSYELTPECRAREDAIDAAFRPVIKKYFYK